jgi:hypothetical protein
LAGLRIGRARDSQVVVGQIFLGPVLVVAARDRVKVLDDRQLHRSLFGIGLFRRARFGAGRVRSSRYGLARPLDRGLDPPSVFDIWFLRHRAHIISAT